MKGYVFLEEKGGYKHLVHLIDKTPNRVGLYPFLIVLSWDRGKHIECVEFNRVLWFPEDTPLEDFKLYLPLEWYCALMKQRGVCDIECLTVKSIPSRIRQAVVGKSRLRRKDSYFVRLAVRRTVNPTNWKIENMTKKKELLFKEAEKLYSLLHYAKGDWKNDVIRIKKVNE